jgi:hypothetical protein
VAKARQNVDRRPSSAVSRKRRKVNPCPKANPNTDLKKALALSERFHQLVPRRIIDKHFDWPRSLTQIGGASQINYLSDKYDGKLKEWWHRFTGRAVVYAIPKPQRDGTNVLIIRGKFKIKREGIIG